ncbi:hypothetical protein B296_00028600 [Ensete ventricosum]|uniref:Uncharacterized protein n=1 Tax=Ensete ventricosum TaxID=4639 RepID=A0A427AMM8_ENSVE|nr:hypothetical protein B296_00028600 [Ensete ventricosum]
MDVGGPYPFGCLWRAKGRRGFTRTWLVSSHNAVRPRTEHSDVTGRRLTPQVIDPIAVEEEAICGGI